MDTLELWGTLGPACADPDILSQMLESGMSGLRINLSHCRLKDVPAWMEAVRKASHKTGKPCALLMDLQGPELRLGGKGLPLAVKPGQVEELPLPGELKALPEGTRIELDDGKLHAERVKGGWRFLNGGVVLPHKSVFGKDLHLHLPVLTEADRENIAGMQEAGISCVMQPFVRSGEDVRKVRALLPEGTRLYAKIEDLEGVAHAEEIAEEADVLVIARGDLGNAAGLANLPRVQTELEERMKKAGRPYMVVTDFLAGMIEHDQPTRAEVSDIFHAVLDGASSLMLTGETAAGKYPAAAMNYFCAVARSGQKMREERKQTVSNSAKICHYG